MENNLKTSNCMLGAVCGDICGSIYEWNNIKHKISESELMNERCTFTDDSVMTIAVAMGIDNAIKKTGGKIHNYNGRKILLSEIQNAMREVGLRYPYAGYGGNFSRWLRAENPKPYNSWGNGSAMRASYCGWVANSLEEAEMLGEISASVTHNHIEGLCGAKVTAGCVFILRNGGTKADVKKYAENYYDLNFTLDDIRNDYTFDVSCQGTMPYAILSFLEANSFADTVSNAISIGGDSDTLAAIAGSIAEPFYPISKDLKRFTVSKLDEYLTDALTKTVECISDD